jgi:hypothetical protein
VGIPIINDFPEKALVHVRPIEFPYGPDAHLAVHVAEMGCGDDYGWRRSGTDKGSIEVAG